MDQPLLRIRGLSKAFGHTRALDRVDLDLAAGSVFALVGHNGAGKTTLIQLVAGILRPDAGTILLRGAPVDRRRIAFVHQDLGLVDSMTVAENVALGDGYPTRALLVNWSATRRAAAAALRAVGGGIDPRARVGALSRTDRCLVAIARALAVNRELLVLDEPTENLPAGDVERLFALLRELRTHGVGMLYVSHRLGEVLRIADRVGVLRDGRLVADAEAATVTEADLAALSWGRRMAEITAIPPPAHRRTVLAVDGLVAPGVGPVSFALASGEALGLVGLSGAGHDRIAAALWGDVPVLAGRVVLAGHPFRPTTPAAAAARGIARCTGHREENLALALTVRENLFANAGLTGVGGYLARRAERVRTLDVLRTFDVRSAEPDRPMGTLSGGNQQKVVLARCLSFDQRLILLEEPTAGVDVAAKADIYALLDAALRAGHAVLLASTDAEEVAKVCQGALVFRRGRVAGRLAGDSLTPHAILAATAGATG